jgi:L-rhamnose isomerase
MDEARHLLQAQHNARLSQLLDVDATEFVGWNMVATFYEAVHYVDALHASESGSPFHSHQERLQFVATGLPSIAYDYELLYHLSRDARYVNDHTYYLNDVSRQIAKRLRADELERIKQAVRNRGVVIP